MTTVKRLAEKWIPEAHSGGFKSAEGHARWWMRAIADELRAQGAGEWAEWLRAQAKDDR